MWHLGHSILGSSPISVDLVDAALIISKIGLGEVPPPLVRVLGLAVGMGMERRTELSNRRRRRVSATLSIEGRAQQSIRKYSGRQYTCRWAKNDIMCTKWHRSKK
jgi:hypothetical protein